MRLQTADLDQGNRHNLPAPLTSFVGREQEMRHIEAQLGTHRLVSLLGPGGAGKTRLAVEAARQMASRFADGACFVELAQIDDPALVVTAVSAALGVPESRTLSVNLALSAALRHRHVLLILDNCEHVLDAAAELCEQLLRACEDVRVMATSREPLGVAGEAHLVLPPLEAPPVGFDLSRLEEFDGAALFLQRARLADPTFAVEDQGAATVADVVRRLDGAPLAIELAAAQLDVMRVDALAERLADRFEVLVNPGRADIARQASLTACVEWSYTRLGSAEQRALRQLSVFAAPFTAAAAAAAVGAEPHRILENLVRRCMVTAPRRSADGATRYGMLETLRAYAWARLVDEGSVDEVESAIATFFTDEAERVTAGFDTGPTELQAASWMDVEYDNLRERLRWAMSHDRTLAVRLAVALAPWWTLRARYREGLAYLTEAHEEIVDAALLERDELWLAWFSQHCSEFERCVDYGERVIAVNAERPPSRELVDALNCVAGGRLNLAALPAARSAAERARRCAQETGYPSGEAFACVVLAAVALYQGDAPGMLEWARAAHVHDAASISGYTDRWRRAMLGVALQLAGDADAADRVRRDLLAMCRSIGDRNMEATTLLSLAEGCLESHRNDESRGFADEAITIFNEHNDELMLTDAFVLTAYYASVRRPIDAARLQAAALSLRKTLGVVGNAHDDELGAKVAAAIARSCSPEQIDDAHERARRMSFDDAVALSREVLIALPAGSDARSSLSARERELLGLVADGLTDLEISQKLFISIRTVRSHLDRIRDKTGCRRRAELTRLALTLST